MSYENRKVDDSVNVSKGSDLGDFLKIGSWFVGGFVLLLVVFQLGARWFAPAIPITWEEYLVSSIFAEANEDDPERNCPRQPWLAELAENLRAPLGLDDDIPLTIHWSDDPIPNAFATLGGHIFIYQGLIDKVDSENAIAMVLAHEMAHIQHRDPIVSLGSGIFVSLMLRTLGVHNTSLVSEATQTQFTQRQERAADAAAIWALEQYYGHLNGAEGFFERLYEEDEDALEFLPSFFSTHPKLKRRIVTIQNRQQDLGQTTPPIPLPAFMHDCP